MFSPGRSAINRASRRVDGMSMRFAVQVVVACAITFGVTHAAAANLGGSDVSVLGADGNVVASCDADGVRARFEPGYDPTDARYELLAVRVDDIDLTCLNRPIAVTVQDAHGTPIATGNSVIGASTVLVPLVDPPQVSDAAGAAIVVP